ncbi:alpha/beta hydrolase family protein [Chamaesiphon minutus]|uniref:Isoform II n=1 Tax=Chamaesiphon minutus (strain ATCC 27169 / PCC 6605) TaxID=1173020 RepID=K9UGU6_CHAP6|nr:isoform II [Chamaesiphon minutus]AFY93863.1 isoform II [Chamaesiphon minutus PCC 6605]
MNRIKYWVLIIFCIAVLVSLGIDAIGGNYRWQLSPALISSLVVLISSLLLMQLKIRSNLVFPTVAGLGVLGVIASAGFTYLYPLFALPVPTGKYPVGTTSIDLVDSSRRELCDPTSRSHRELFVRVWYPASKKTGTKAPYLQDPRLFSSGRFSHLNLIKTAAIVDAPLATADAPYPVAIYSPSWSGYKTDNTFQTQELASHGFVVIGLEHPCAVPMAIYPNGRVIYSTLPAADYTSSDVAMAKFLRVAEEQIALRTRDVSFVIDRVSQIDARLQQWGASDTPPRRTLDLAKIGIFGHSFGGAVAAQSCAVDSRLKAGINMDGLLFGSAAKQGATQPFLFMNSDYPRPTAAELRSPDGSKRRSQLTDEWGFEQRERWFQQHGGYNLTLLNAAHFNFSDTPLKSHIDNGGGKISPERAMKIINAYTVAFFDRQLKGKDSPLLVGVATQSQQRQSGSPFPEAIFENHFSN